jgi:hypothetical protein
MGRDTGVGTGYGSAAELENRENEARKGSSKRSEASTVGKPPKDQEASFLRKLLSLVCWFVLQGPRVAHSPGVPNSRTKSSGASGDKTTRRLA